MNYRIYCPSYKRANIAISHKLFKPEHFSYVVREEEMEAYRMSFPDVDLIAVPEGKVTNLTNTRNWILDNTPENKYHIQIDDDMKAVAWIFKRKPMALDINHLHHIICNMFEMTEDMGLHMWGMNCVEDPMAYRTSKPFHFNRVCLGPWQAFIKTELRYDEVLYLKEDYDFFLQHMHRDGRIFRANYLHYRVDHQKLAGGCQMYRTEEKERAQNRLLEKKWGSKIVRMNWKSPHSINMRIVV